MPSPIDFTKCLADWTSAVRNETKKKRKIPWMRTFSPRLRLWQTNLWILSNAQSVILGKESGILPALPSKGKDHGASVGASGAALARRLDGRGPHHDWHHGGTRPTQVATVNGGPSAHGPSRRRCGCEQSPALRGFGPSLLAHFPFRRGHHQRSALLPHWIQSHAQFTETVNRETAEDGRLLLRPP